MEKAKASEGRWHLVFWTEDPVQELADWPGDEGAKDHEHPDKVGGVSPHLQAIAGADGLRNYLPEDQHDLQERPTWQIDVKLGRVLERQAAAHPVTWCLKRRITVMLSRIAARGLRSLSRKIGRACARKTLRSRAVSNSRWSTRWSPAKIQSLQPTLGTLGTEIISPGRTCDHLFLGE